LLSGIVVGENEIIDWSSNWKLGVIFKLFYNMKKSERIKCMRKR